MNLTDFFKARALRLQKVARKVERGVAALEFALALPIWVTFLLGCTDAAYCLLINQRVDRISYTITDIITQSEKVNKTDLDHILLAAGQLMQPYQFGSQGIVIVSSLYKPAGEAVTINWQYVGGGSLARSSRLGAAGQTPVLPSGFVLNDNDNVIVVEVYYAFVPLFTGDTMFPAADVYRRAFYKPRLTALTATPL